MSSFLEWFEPLTIKSPAETRSDQTINSRIHMTSHSNDIGRNTADKQNPVSLISEPKSGRYVPIEII